MAKVQNAVEILQKIRTASVECKSVTDRQTTDRQTDRRTGDSILFAKNDTSKLYEIFRTC